MKLRTPEERKLKVNGTLAKNRKFESYSYEDFVVWQKIFDPNKEIFDDFESYIEECCSDENNLVYGWIVDV